MPRQFPNRFFRGCAVLCACLALAACTAAPIPPSGAINDPQEADNREVHAFNKGVDRAILRPVSRAYGAVVPDPVAAAVGRASSNLGQPANVVNNLLQFRLGEAMHNTLRFLLNSTVGVAGLFDPATALGVPERDTDFGETLHLWGIAEGSYVELPLLGPSTTRDTAGLVVDFALNPLRGLADPSERDIITGVRSASRLGDRDRFGDTIDQVLYDSEDSYAQTRSLYLQNRRFNLRGDQEAEYFDPYEDPYDQAFSE